MGTLALVLVASFGAFQFTSANGEELEVTIHNVSKTILTPPIIAVGDRSIENFHTVGEPASVALEELAEGGSTDALKEYYEDRGARVTQLTEAIPPGESITIKVPGYRRSGVVIGSMLLPTNDAFVTANLSVKRRGAATAQVRSYDAGTEYNSEMTADIPGPFGGEGFNADRDDVDFVHRHPGLNGTGDVDANMYDWEDPVANISVKVVR